MGLSMISVMMICGNGKNVRAEATQSGKKFVGWINLYKNGHLHASIADTGPRYGTAQEAVDDMKRTIKEIRKQFKKGL